MANINLLASNMEIVECIHPVDLDSTAQTGDYIDMSGYDGVLVVNYQGTLGAAVALSIDQCTEDADAGSDAKAITTDKDFAPVANTITVANIAGSDMDSQGGFRWLKISTDDPGAASVGCVLVIGYRARYAEDTMPALV